MPRVTIEAHSKGTTVPLRRPLAALSALSLTVLLAACGSPAPEDPNPAASDPGPLPATPCPDPVPGAFGGPAVLLESADLLGADDLPADVCAYGSESGESIWIIAQPYDAGFPTKIADWLEPLGWTAEQRDTWGEGDLENVAFLPPDGLTINQAFAHAFSAYPESVSFNMGIDQEFLSQFGVEPGDELGIFAAWR
jgi:hypothetical protein